MIIRIFLFFSIFFFLSISKSISLEIKIKAEINNEIITNIDIENEKKYLIFLNPRLNELKNKDIQNIAQNSLIKEIIKKKELKKFFDVDKEYNFVDKIEKNLLLKKNIKNKDEFINFLNSNNLKYNQIRNKLKIEALWNQLVYKKYINNVKLDEELMRKKIVNQIKNSKKKYEYNLSEILFEEKINENYTETLKKINESIKNVGFENTANILSISNTSKNGGFIGWINELQIADKIKKKIADLKINEFTQPIKIPNGYLIIKLNDKKEFDQKIDVEKELKKFIENEKNRQLNNFSIIFYKRLKQNTIINEY